MKPFYTTKKDTKCALQTPPRNCSASSYSRRSWRWCASPAERGERLWYRGFPTWKRQSTSEARTTVSRKGRGEERGRQSTPSHTPPRGEETLAEGQPSPLERSTVWRAVSFVALGTVSSYPVSLQGTGSWTGPRACPLCASEGRRRREESSSSSRFTFTPPYIFRTLETCIRKQAAYESRFQGRTRTRPRSDLASPLFLFMRAKSETWT